MPAILYKDPDDEVDYFIPWDAWLRPGDTITESDIQIAGTSPPTVTANTINGAANGVTMWLEGGVMDTDYEGFNEVVTAAGRRGKRRFIIQCTKIFTEKGA